MTRAFVPAHLVAGFLEGGWRIVYEVRGGAHPVTRPRGYIMEKS